MHGSDSHGVVPVTRVPHRPADVTTRVRNISLIPTRFVSDGGCPAGGRERFDKEQLGLQHRQWPALAVDSNGQSAARRHACPRSSAESLADNKRTAQSSSSSAVSVPIPLSRGMVRGDRKAPATACGSSMPSRMRSLLIRAARRGSRRSSAASAPAASRDGADLEAAQGADYVAVRWPISSASISSGDRC